MRTLRRSDKTYRSVVAAQVSDDFDVVGLGEHIKGYDRIESVTTSDQFFEISGESRWIAGDVSDSRRAKREYSADDGIFRARTGRI